MGTGAYNQFAKSHSKVQPVQMLAQVARRNRNGSQETFSKRFRQNILENRRKVNEALSFMMSADQKRVGS